MPFLPSARMTWLRFLREKGVATVVQRYGRTGLNQSFGKSQTGRSREERDLNLRAAVAQLAFDEGQVFNLPTQDTILPYEAAGNRRSGEPHACKAGTRSNRITTLRALNWRANAGGLLS